MVMRPGMIVGDQFGAQGTLALILKNRVYDKGSRFMLSAAHVMASLSTNSACVETPTGSTGSAVEAFSMFLGNGGQVGAFPVGPQDAVVVGRVVQQSCLSNADDHTNTNDAAVCTIDQPQDWEILTDPGDVTPGGPAYQIVEDHHPIDAVIGAGTGIIRFGAKTGLAHGTLSRRTRTTTTVVVSGVPLPYDQLVEYQCDVASEEGDSGALIAACLSPPDAPGPIRIAPVAMHVGGASNISYCYPLEPVLGNLWDIAHDAPARG